MSTTGNKRLNYNSTAALAYVKNGHGISLSDFTNHYFMVFNLTRTHSRSNTWFYLLRVNKLFIIRRTQIRCSVAAQHWNFISQREMLNNLYRFFEKRFQNRSSYNLMDEDEFKLTLQSGVLLMFNFDGVYAADNFPPNMPANSFVIVNTSPSLSPGSHWIMLANRYAYTIT